MSGENELKPCPWCRCVIDVTNEDTFQTCENGEYYFVVCTMENGGCGASGPAGESVAKAADKWDELNRATQPFGIP